MGSNGIGTTGPGFHAPAPAALRVLAAVGVTALLVALPSCSIKRMAIKSVANSLTSGPDVYATDDDPELIRDALPFGLKTLESLLATLPEHRGLLLASCRGFTQYSYAYVQSDADVIEATDYGRATALRERALKLYLRARGYGMRGLELKNPGIGKRLELHPDSAAALIGRKDIDLLYWTAAAWGSAIAIGKDRPELIADLSAVKALMDRGLALDEGYDGGSIHEALIVLEALPPAMGGSVERARAHFDRAVELSHGQRAGPYVTLATTVSVQTQDRGEFERLLHRALEVDPNRDPNQRLATLLLQQKARMMLDHVDDYFIAPDTTQTGEGK
jgi:predicted anti-sigma-YlaC factor YlaD